MAEHSNCSAFIYDVLSAFFFNIPDSSSIIREFLVDTIPLTDAGLP